MHRWWSCFSLVGVISCIGSEAPPLPRRTVALGRLPSPQLDITQRPNDVYVTLKYDQRLLGGCDVLDDDVSVTIDGQPIAIVERGGAYDDVECDWPTFAGPVLWSGSPRLALAEPADAIVCQLSELSPPRTATLVPDAPWRFHPGEEVTVRWSPTVDLVQTYTSAKLALWTWFDLPLRITDDLMTFTLPSLPSSSLPMSGTLELQVRADRTLPPPDCGSVPATARYVGLLLQPVDIEAPTP
jgi:hypothetical protein